MLQPHEGPSETERLTDRWYHEHRFNPTRVRLKPFARRVPQRRGRRFNPTRVRLKLSVGAILPGADCLGFNPTRVRLKQITEEFEDLAATMLQPHEGPSETSRPVASSSIVAVLQPHEGPSETRPRGQRHDVPDGFNPTRVRLKRESLRDILHVLERLQPHEGPSETRAGPSSRLSARSLQPHEGPSETRRRASRPGTARTCFNPTRVRLKRYPLPLSRNVFAGLQPHEGPSETMPDFRATDTLLHAHDKGFLSTRNSRQTPRGSTTGSTGNAGLQSGPRRRRFYQGGYPRTVRR